MKKEDYVMIRKRIFAVAMCVIALLGSMTPVEVNAKECNYENVDEYYYSIYEKSFVDYDCKVVNDESAYCLLKEKRDSFELKDGFIDVDFIKIKNDCDLEASEEKVLKEFVSNINFLINVGIIRVDDNLLIHSAELETKPKIRTDKISIGIMDECRRHAAELRRVYDRAPFTEKYITAGVFFAEKVKTGGDWDYKSYLGTHTVYYVEDLHNNMTGEAIGNFHYGYVGSEIYNENVLKLAAGFYQFVSGTSQREFWKSYFDDPRDQLEIQKGINKYRSEH